MSAMRDAVIENAPLVLAVGGLVIGFLFGLAVYRTNYCAMGSLVRYPQLRRLPALPRLGAGRRDRPDRGHAARCGRRRRSQRARCTWRRPSTGSAISAGGLIFGVGMVFAGGCPSRNLARAGGGDLRALLTLMVLGLVAFMTIAGVLAPARAALEGATSRHARAGAEPGPRRPSRARTRVLRAVWAKAAAAAGLCRGGARLLLRRRQVPPIAAAHRLGPRRRPHGGGGLGADGARLRRDGGPAHAADLAHLHPPGGRHLAVAVALYRHADAGVRRGERIRRAARRVRGGRGHGPVPPGHLRRRRRHGAQPAGRGADGRGRRDGAGLHRRPGRHRRLDARARLVPHLRRHRRRRLSRGSGCWSGGSGRIECSARPSTRSMAGYGLRPVCVPG